MSIEDDQRAKYPHLHIRFRYNKDGTLTNGIFDNEEYQRREQFDNGVLIQVASRMWIELDEKISRLPYHFKLQWGTYPPLPERLKK
jgi:hypothetical protein